MKREEALALLEFAQHDDQKVPDLDEAAFAEWFVATREMRTPQNATAIEQELERLEFRIAQAVGRHLGRSE